MVYNNILFLLNWLVHVELACQKLSKGENLLDFACFPPGFISTSFNTFFSVCTDWNVGLSYLISSDVFSFWTFVLECKNKTKVYPLHPWLHHILTVILGLTCNQECSCQFSHNNFICPLVPNPSSQAVLVHPTNFGSDSSKITNHLKNKVNNIENKVNY